MRHLLTLADLTAAEMERIFAIAEDLKAKFQSGLREPLLPGRVLALLFEKPSLRTRVSFEAAIVNLGGSSIYLGREAGWKTRESVADFGRVLSQYVDIIVVRAFEHASVVELAEHCTVPVINGLTDCCHPCQALADLFTLRELYGSLRGLRLAFVGDCNNVARSLAEACATLGVELHIACPAPHQFDEAVLAELRRRNPQARLLLTEDPAEAVRDAAAVYTDVWASMGQEAEQAQRRADFAPYQVSSKLLAAAPRACFMHCLPAHRGEEVTDEVMDGPQSVVIQQAANRMHVQKGILAWLLGSQG